MRRTRIAGAIFAGAAVAAVVMGGPASADTGTSGDYSILGGNQVQVPINVPVNACGNAIGVLGQANAGAECTAVGSNSL
jgi:hypothetical protein